MWQVIDRQTGLSVGKPYASKARARSRVDTLDNAYGAYRYSVRLLARATESAQGER